MHGPCFDPCGVVHTPGWPITKILPLRTIWSDDIMLRRVYTNSPIDFTKKVGAHREREDAITDVA